jgi:hypothetical protein
MTITINPLTLTPDFLSCERVDHLMSAREAIDPEYFCRILPVRPGFHRKAIEYADGGDGGLRVTTTDVEIVHDLGDPARAP